MTGSLRESLVAVHNTYHEYRALVSEIRRDMAQMKREDGYVEAYSTLGEFLFFCFVVGTVVALDTRTGKLLFAVAAAIAFGKVIR